MQALAGALPKLDNRNAANEYYLTDVVGILAREGKQIVGVRVPDKADCMGINTPEQLAEVFSMSEGLENRMVDQIRRSSSLDEFVDNVKSKRYPETRIRRILCQMLMGLTDFEDEFYARPLAASSKGTALLKRIKKNSDIQVITNINKEEQLPDMLKYDILAADIYNVVTGADLYKKSDYVVHPFIQKG
jgi:hypothetical protein